MAVIKKQKDDESKKMMKTKRVLKVLIACLLAALLAYSGALLLALHNKRECEKILQYYNEQYEQEFYIRVNEGHFLAWLSLPPKAVHDFAQTMLRNQDTRFPNYTLREEDLRD